MPMSTRTSWTRTRTTTHLLRRCCVGCLGLGVAAVSILVAEPGGFLPSLRIWAGTSPEWMPRQTSCDLLLVLRRARTSFTPTRPRCRLRTPRSPPPSRRSRIPTSMTSPASSRKLDGCFAQAADSSTSAITRASWARYRSTRPLPILHPGYRRAGRWNAATAPGSTPGGWRARLGSYVHLPLGTFLNAFAGLTLVDAEETDEEREYPTMIALAFDKP